MRKARFTEEQMVAIIREADREPVSVVAKQHKAQISGVPDGSPPTRARETARSPGLQVHILNAGCIDAAFAILVEQRIGMVLAGADPFFLRRRNQFCGAGGAPRGWCDLLRARVRDCWRLDELWHEHGRRLSPRRRLHWKNPQERKTRRPVRRAVDQVRVRHQSQNRRRSCHVVILDGCCNGLRAATRRCRTKENSDWAG
jgi:hypothetical protein